jgi:hypothetical protein
VVAFLEEQTVVLSTVEQCEQEKKGEEKKGDRDGGFIGL